MSSTSTLQNALVSEKLRLIRWEWDHGETARAVKATLDLVKCLRSIIEQQEGAHA